MAGTYGPPMSDSEEDDLYDGYSFGDDVKLTKKEARTNWVEEPDRKLYEALLAGNLESVKHEVEALKLHVDDRVKGGYTMLLYACLEGHLSIVEYLLEDLHANVNKQVDSVTALHCACDCSTQDSYTVEKIVTLLLKHDAVINFSDKFGTTPLMNACKNGHLPVVRLLIRNASLEAMDNQGSTAIFHAIEKNHPEIVKLLVEAGADCTAANGKGYTPVAVAQFHGFYDLLDILPKMKESYFVPTKFLGYNSLSDYIPRIFLKTECPEYFQEINPVLKVLHLEFLLEYFAKGNVSYSEFLSISDKRLDELGIEMPITKNRIHKVLLYHHLTQWRLANIAKVGTPRNESFYKILMVAANHLQHLVKVAATIRYIRNNITLGYFGNVALLQWDMMHAQAERYRGNVEDLERTVKYLSSFSPPRNPLYIDYDEYMTEKKTAKWKRYFKYTTILISLSVVVCLKTRAFRT